MTLSDAHAIPTGWRFHFSASIFQPLATPSVNCWRIGGFEVSRFSVCNPPTWLVAGWAGQITSLTWLTLLTWEGNPVHSQAFSVRCAILAPSLHHPVRARHLPVGASHQVGANERFYSPFPTRLVTPGVVDSPHGTRVAMGKVEVGPVLIGTSQGSARPPRGSPFLLVDRFTPGPESPLVPIPIAMTLFGRTV